MKLTTLPEDTIQHYNISDKATTDGYVYVEIRKGMYRLLQAGIITQQLLEERLAKHGYNQSTKTPWFW